MMTLRIFKKDGSESNTISCNGVSEVFGQFRVENYEGTATNKWFNMKNWSYEEVIEANLIDRVEAAAAEARAEQEAVVKYYLPKIKTAHGDYVISVLNDDMVTFSRVDQFIWERPSFDTVAKHAAAIKLVEELMDKDFMSKFVAGVLNVTFMKEDK